ncbi:OmpA family protein [Polyangium sp. 15x6]|uniref:OmpA family protein n=1 Tax=Polyangium sp. 15x6 TaxID=3042687 RepID=UPI00249BD4BC|nr:OmpA family protein [Polyangium sp. 15x6]MDI3284236.1 OmpA family protein [Polyangium sp. 15x6]
MRRSSLLLATFLAASAATGDAPAQTPAGNIGLGRFEPAPAGDTFFGLPSPASRGHLVVRGFLLFDYADRPLRVFLNDRETALVAGQGFLRGDVSFALWDRFLVSAQIPVAIVQRGESPDTPGVLLSPPSSAALGDIRLGARVRVFGESNAVLQLGLGGYLYVPTMSDGAFLSDGTIHGNLHAALGGRFLGRLLWNASTGITFRSSQPNTFTAGAGIAALLWKERLQVGPELNTFISLGDTRLAAGPLSTLVQPPRLGAELLVGARVWPLAGLMFGVAGGPGFGEGIGTPAFRVVAMAGWAPKSDSAKPVPSIGDRDGDGLRDTADACPDKPGVLGGDPSKDGCPIEDRDGDGIIDEQDGCPTEPGQPNEELTRHGCPPDADGDGVSDAKDACPKEAGKANQDPSKNGCLPDRDDDGLVDMLDACPDQKGIRVDDPNQRGCPEDLDGDGVKWPSDACPNTYGTPKEDPAKNGCPILEIKGDEIVIDFEIRFQTYGKWRSTTTTKISDEQLRVIRDELERHPEIEQIEIQGHTDDSGDPRFNRHLSEERAQAVRDWLIRVGVPPQKLVTRGYGHDNPVGDNRIFDGREQNRRVVFRILKKR